MNEVMGGVFNLFRRFAGEEDIALEISENKTKCSFTYEDGKPHILVETQTDVFLNESFIDLNTLDLDTITYLEQCAQQRLENEIKALIRKVQPSTEAIYSDLET
jgi:hypothetical protein